MAAGLSSLALASVLALLLAGCGQAPGAAPPPDEPLPAADLLIREATPALDFSATLAPEMALAPELARAVRAEALAYQANMQAQAANDMKEARAAGFPARPYAVIQRWTAEAETPALLAFSGMLWEYTGGAHGNSNFAVTLYDRANGRRMGTNDLFTDPKAALAALQKPWCTALAEAQRQKRGSGPSAFDDCPALADLPIVPTGNGSITGLKVLAAPYVAGAYAEGAYEVLLDPAPIVPHLKPEWRAAFGAEAQTAR